MRTISSDERDIQVEFFVESICNCSAHPLHPQQKVHMQAYITEFFEMMDRMGLFSWDDLPKALEEFNREPWQGLVTNFITKKDMNDAIN